MAEKRKCLCCEKEYEYCVKCGKSQNMPWKVNFDSEPCKELFNIVSAYNMNLVKEDRIKEVLDKYSITDYSVYKKSIRDVLEKLFSTKKEEFIPVIEEPVSEELPIQNEYVEDTSFDTQEEVINETPRGRRRNRFFE